MILTVLALGLGGVFVVALGGFVAWRILRRKHVILARLRSAGRPGRATLVAVHARERYDEIGKHRIPYYEGEYSFLHNGVVYRAEHVLNREQRLIAQGRVGSEVNIVYDPEAPAVFLPVELLAGSGV